MTLAHLFRHNCTVKICQKVFSSLPNILLYMYVIRSMLKMLILHCICIKYTQIYKQTQGQNQNKLASPAEAIAISECCRIQKRRS